MKITYEDKDYSLDLDEMDVSQATTIKRKYGFSLLSLETGLREGDVDALRCVYWLMLSQNGERVNVDNVNFKVVKFAVAVQEASIKEAEEAQAKAEQDPKEAA
jgi:hypothetical protein